MRRSPVDNICPVRASQNLNPTNIVRRTARHIFLGCADTLLKRFPFVMLVLVENVLPYCLEMRWTHAEKSIAIVPVKLVEARIQRFNKFRRILLENFQNLRR